MEVSVGQKIEVGKCFRGSPCISKPDPIEISFEIISEDRFAVYEDGVLTTTHKLRLNNWACISRENRTLENLLMRDSSTERWESREERFIADGFPTYESRVKALAQRKEEALQYMELERRFSKKPILKRKN